MSWRRPASDEERGFSLIELMVVVLIIAMLIAIAIPTFLGATQRADDRATQANVRNAFTASRVYYNEAARYPDPAQMVAEMEEVEPSLEWSAASLDATSSDKTIRIHVFDVPDTRQTVVVVGRTGTGRCFYLKDVMGGATAGTYYQADVSGGAACPDVVDPDTIAGSSWTD